MSWTLPTLLALGLLIGCAGQEGPDQPETAAPRADSPHAALAAMDSRTPVPLLPMMARHMKADMLDHLLVVQEITAALAEGDFDAVSRSASRIAYTEDLANRCDHMGSGAPGFPEKGVEFHRAASGIQEAAKAKDRDGVLRALGETIAVCNDCHGRFRQEVVDAATWERRTGSAAPHAQ